ncbi:MAG: PKD domain-containing protein [Chitinophagaceae bacterium]
MITKATTRNKTSTVFMSENSLIGRYQVDMLTLPFAKPGPPGHSVMRKGLMFIFRIALVLLIACLSAFSAGASDERSRLFADTTIINSYTPVFAYDDCGNGLEVGNGSLFKVGDTVLLIQMKGASINVANSSAFGSITNLGNAGNYEFNYVESISGNQIKLRYVLERSFDYADGKVQLIRVPFFENLSTTTVLSALPWDGEIGGVLAFNVRGVLDLNGDIDVSGRGFRGGQAITHPNFVCNFSDFVTLQTDGSVAARKGEGIYNTTTLLNGRGKLANGGGGGNSTNSGGAGGGNGGNGGSGGNQFVGCGTGTFINGGIGGLALPYSTSANRIFMGGGGGAGHQNDQPALGSGGNGGGIIIISAGTIQTNGFKIMSDGSTPPHSTGTNDDGRSGGGAGGTILLNFTTAVGNIAGSVKGGNGDFCSPPGGDPHGPGGGGGGGVVWLNKSTITPDLNFDIAGGSNGTNTNLGNNALGATAGTSGIVLTGLQLAVAEMPFQPNIDSVRFNYFQKACTEVEFTGLAFTNGSSIVSWSWDLGDGSVSSAQNPSHLFAATGTYSVKLVVTDAMGCRDSISRSVTLEKKGVYFTYTQQACNPFAVSFSASALPANSYWDFGDGVSVSGESSPTHLYAAGEYDVIFISNLSGCVDTTRQVISVAMNFADVILTPDTTICAGAEKQLRALSSSDFCWSPSSFLTNGNTNNPTTNTPSDIVYNYTMRSEGANLLANSDFEVGATGFSSEYQFNSLSGSLPGTYTVSSDVVGWNSTLGACTEHGTGSGNMLIVNGSVEKGKVVWEQTVAVTPGTRFGFGTYVQNLNTIYFPGLNLLINGQNIPLRGSPGSQCNWELLQAIWFSETNSSATLQLVSSVDWEQGNDFAIDDVRFASFEFLRDSVAISVEVPAVKAGSDSTICFGTAAQLQVSGAAQYLWTPAEPLNDANSANPTAILENSTEFIVEGTSVNGCIARDTVMINLFALPTITTSNDTSICRNSSVQLSASGGASYLWAPSATLNDAAISNPVASPSVDTKYYVTVTDVNTCQFRDSVEVSIRSLPNFSIDGPKQVCLGDSVRIHAGGGDLYNWSPTTDMSDSHVSSPTVWPSVNTVYSVEVTESVCNESATLTTSVNVLPTPEVRASRSNDIDCTIGASILNATGAVQYEWWPTTSLDNPTVRNPRAQPSTTTVYSVKGTDLNGCVGVDSVKVSVDFSNLSNYQMPSAFTPNGDGLNDCYGIKYWGVVEKIEFSVYNRWGERVFYTTDPNSCWNGTYKGIKQDAGVFIYMIRASTACADDVFRKGSFVLIR